MPDLIKVGAVAPDFELEASDGNTYSLSQMLGEDATVALIFYPMNNTPG